MTILEIRFTLDIVSASDLDMMEIYEALQRVPNVREVHNVQKESDRDIYHVVMWASMADERFAADIAKELARHVHIESESGSHLILRIGEPIEEGKYSVEDQAQFGASCNAMQFEIETLQRLLATRELGSQEWHEKVSSSVNRIQSGAQELEDIRNHLS